MTDKMFDLLTRLHHGAFYIRGADVQTARRLENLGLAKLSAWTRRPRWSAVLTPAGTKVLEAAALLERKCL